MFDPRNGGYWLIGPNRETGDTFYLCHECTKFMDEPETPAQRIDEEGEEEEEEDNYLDNDSDGEWEYYEEEPQQGNYDHGEECC